MDRLIKILAGLIVGLPGVRREALDMVLEMLRSEYENLKGILDYTEEMANRRAHEMRDDAIRRAGEAQRRIGQLEAEVVRLGSLPSIYTWRIMVRRRVLASHKFHCIRALRELTGLGLKEAKEWVEDKAIVANNQAERDWVTLGEGIGPREFGTAIDTLLRATVNTHTSPQPTYPEDVSFDRFERDNISTY